MFTPRRTVEYEEQVAWAVRAKRAPVTGPVEVDIVVRIHGRGGDVDNYAKSILDGLVKGGGIGDDRDVVRLGVRLERVPRDQQSASVVWAAAAEVGAAAA